MSTITDLTPQNRRLFRVFCARQVQHLLTDPRSIKAIDTAEKFANGKTTEKQLTRARKSVSAIASAICIATLRLADTPPELLATWVAKWATLIEDTDEEIGTTIAASETVLELLPDAEHRAMRAQREYLESLLTK